MKKIYFITFLLSAVLAGCGNNTTEPTANQPNMGQANAAASPTTDVKTYSAEELALHNTEQDCWLLIDGKIYDVTEFIPSHPGGQAILQGCGKDATTFFESRPMGSGTPHSEQARIRRENYYIGDLK